jgi:hypothetical protein
MMRDKHKRQAHNAHAQLLHRIRTWRCALNTLTRTTAHPQSGFVLSTRS